MIVACIYSRISADREGLALGVERQEEDCRKLAERLGWQVGHVYTDNDISASTRSYKTRPNFEAMVAAVEAGEFGAILYYSNSRLTRRPLEYERIISLVERSGVKLASVASGSVDLTTAGGQMLGRMLAAADAAEAERTSERILRAFEQRRENGKPHGGKSNVGFLPADPAKGIGHCTHVDPMAAEHIQAGIETILTGGNTSTVMARWNAEGFTTPSGKPWKSLTSVKRVLVNPKLAGLIVHQGEVVGYSPVAVIDRATHEAVKAALDNPRTGARRHYLLSGFIRCGLCESVAQIMVSHANGKVYTRYMCLTRRGGCGKTSRSRQWLEAVVSEYVAERIRAEYESGEGNKPLSNDPDEVAFIEKRLAEVREDVINGNIPPQDGGTMLNALRAKLAAAKVTAAATAKAGVTFSREDLLDAWLDEVKPLHERRDILAKYVDHVKLFPVRGTKKIVGIAALPKDSIEIVPAQV